MIQSHNRPKFSLGATVATPGALAAMTATGESPRTLLGRHVRGDWGDLDADDIRANDWSLENDARLLSAYTLKDGTKIWVITEADRSSTCILLPEEY